MLDIAWEVRGNSQAKYSNGPPHMDEQNLDDQLKPNYSGCVPTELVSWKTYWEQLAIETGDKRWSEKSVLAARQDDDDNDINYLTI